jgi:DNA-binding GntR family transcriptional regulator
VTATITEYISRDLTTRVGAGTLTGGLTLSGLSAHYRVSITPVRQAVRWLVAQGVLLKGGNGRVEVNPLRVGSGQPEAVTPSPLDPPAWEGELTAELIRLSLRGAAVFLREEATAGRFGVGRTVLRQGFNRLAGQGLLEHVPRCGWRVRAFDEADMDAYLEVRETLELKALDLARGRLVRADLERMLLGNAEVLLGEPDRLDNDLHAYLVQKAGNAYIEDFFDRHGRYYTTLFDHAAPEASVVREMAGQHREILQALLAEDWPAARRALARHIRAQKPVVRALLQRARREAGCA